MWFSPVIVDIIFSLLYNSIVGIDSKQDWRPTILKLVGLVFMFGSAFFVGDLGDALICIILAVVFLLLGYRLEKRSKPPKAS